MKLFVCTGCEDDFNQFDFQIWRCLPLAGIGVAHIGKLPDLLDYSRYNTSGMCVHVSYKHTVVHLKTWHQINWNGRNHNEVLSKNEFQKIIWYYLFDLNWWLDSAAVDS